MNNKPIYSNISTASLDYVAYYLYTVEGAVIFVFNSFLVIIILSTPKLRQQKEYIIFTGSLIFDVFFGFGYLAAGIRRLFIYYGPIKAFSVVELYKLWNCFFTPHSIFIVFIIPGTGIMALATSIDRVFSVFKPYKYISLKTRYAWFLIGGAMLINFPTFIASAIAAYMEDGTFLQPLTCTLNTTLTMLSILEGVRVVTTILAVLLYFPIWRKVYSLFRSSSSTTSQQQTMTPEQRQRFMRMTLTMTLITLSELLLFIIPDIYFTIYPDVYSMFLNCVTLNKGTVNIFIFLFTQRELRRAILRQICCFSEVRKNLHTSIAPIRAQIAPRTNS